MGYDRKKLIPGYKGKFVIHEHGAEKAGPHWDLRLEFPVESQHKALKQYEGKRIPGTSEPMEKYPEKEGSVYRSFVSRKRSFPAGDKKIFLIETEDHPISYGTFKGTIPAGQYGAGKVDIFDKGTFELLDVEGDKKYILDFHGKKLKGVFALVKYQNGYLWIKVKEKQASVVDYPQATMSPKVWDIEQDLSKLRPNIRKTIINTLSITLERGGFKRPFRWIKGLYIAGSVAGYVYRKDSDLDIDITYNPLRVVELNPFLKGMSKEQVFEKLKKVTYKANKKRVGNTPHTFSYMILEPGDVPMSEGVYDVMEDEWVRGPIKVPKTFDPDIAFERQRLVAIDFCKKIENVILGILATIEDLKKTEGRPNLQGKRALFLTILKSLCDRLDQWHYFVRSLPEQSKYKKDPVYPAFPFGPNWEQDNIIFKYMSRWGYTYPVRVLFERLKGDPYLRIVDKFIPD